MDPPSVVRVGSARPSVRTSRQRARGASCRQGPSIPRRDVHERSRTHRDFDVVPEAVSTLRLHRRKPHRAPRDRHCIGGIARSGALIRRARDGTRRRETARALERGEGGRVRFRFHRHVNVGPSATLLPSKTWRLRIEALRLAKRATASSGLKPTRGGNPGRSTAARASTKSLFQAAAPSPSMSGRIVGVLSGRQTCVEATWRGPAFGFLPAFSGRLAPAKSANRRTRASGTAPRDRRELGDENVSDCASGAGALRRDRPRRGRRKELCGGHAQLHPPLIRASLSSGCFRLMSAGTVVSASLLRRSRVLSIMCGEPTTRSRTWRGPRRNTSGADHRDPRGAADAGPDLDFDRVDVEVARLEEAHDGLHLALLLEARGKDPRGDDGADAFPCALTTRGYRRARTRRATTCHPA